jgi:hypothetical protein
LTSFPFVYHGQVWDEEGRRLRLWGGSRSQPQIPKGDKIAVANILAFLIFRRVASISEVRGPQKRPRGGHRRARRRRCRKRLKPTPPDTPDAVAKVLFPKVVPLIEPAPAPPVARTSRPTDFLEHHNPYDVGMTGLFGNRGGYHTLTECDTLLLLG